MMRRSRKRQEGIHQNLYEALIFVGLCGGLWLKIIYAQLSIKVNKLPVRSEVNDNMFVMALLSVLVVMILLYIISWKKGLLIPSIGAAFIAFVILADTLYGRYYYNPTTVSIFNQLYMAQDVSSSAFNLFKWKDIIFILDFLVIGLVILGRKFIDLPIKPTKHFGKRALILAGIMILALGSFTFKFNQLDRTNYAYERKYIARDLGLIYYHGYDISKAVESSLVTKKLTDEEVKMVIESNGYHNGESNDFTGKAKGQNLLVIQVEAFMDYLLGYEVNGQAITPFLNGLVDESLYFSENYFQTANGNTVDAELMMNTSLLPGMSGAVYYEYPSNTYQTLPKALKEEGYNSYSFHGYEASFWNRAIMHPNLGFDRFHSLDDFVLDEKIGWAISDASFYRQSLDFTQAQTGEDPFYSFLITLSSHHPYDAFSQGPFQDPTGENHMMWRYYNAAAYVDQTIEGLFQELKDRGLYENTLVVIYGDHGGLFAGDAVEQVVSDNKEYNAYTWATYAKIPVIIHNPKVFDEGLFIEKVTGQVDIMPTVANLLGLDGLYTLGHDVLDDQYEGFAAKRFGDVISDDFIYIADENTYYDRGTGDIVNSDLYEEDVVKAKKLLQVNDMILASDYFKDLEE